MTTLLKDLSSASEKIVIIRDTPKAEYNAPDCLSRAQWLAKNLADSCRVAPIDSAQDHIFIAEKNAAGEFDNVSTADLTINICDKPSCSLYVNGYVIFSDKAHLSVAFSASLAAHLGKALAFDQPTKLGKIQQPRDKHSSNMWD